MRKGVCDVNNGTYIAEEGKISSGGGGRYGFRIVIRIFMYITVDRPLCISSARCHLVVRRFRELRPVGLH
jgi:hypothetical protein